MKMDGSIDKYKARLVVEGYKQQEWLNYFIFTGQLLKLLSSTCS